jgi:hypothetical protein
MSREQSYCLFITKFKGFVLASNKISVIIVASGKIFKCYIVKQNTAVRLIVESDNTEGLTD